MAIDNDNIVDLNWKLTNHKYTYLHKKISNVCSSLMMISGDIYMHADIRGATSLVIKNHTGNAINSFAMM